MKPDYYTNTVEDAAEYEKMRARSEGEDIVEHDFDVDDDIENDEDDCNCSDPGCPCGGIKRGTL